MALAIDASTPALASGTSSSTTASFTAPAGSLLVALCADEDGTVGTMSNSSTALTWTARVSRTSAESGVFVSLIVFTAVAATSVARTVTYTSAVGGSQTDLKVLVVTGADVVGTPAGAVGEGNSTTINLTVNAYTSTVANSRGVGIAADGNAAGNPTSSDTGFAFNHAGAYSGIAVHKAADTAVGGSTVTLNFNGGASARDWAWVAVEILPEVVPFLAPRPLILGQAVNRAFTF
ncbi:hypothetical protein AB0F17_08255 [Nonomuraea sp. NPDC026600]|uniref:hypothetical protein n=1 Tax=Nonomuraea sp. NPDC026600 TaxID=3155363 RepID=UPI0033E1B8F8